MTHDRDAKTFADTLSSIEAKRDPSALIALFAEDASVDSVALHKPIHGIGAIAQFWQEYLAFFDEIATTFTRVTAADSIAALEWSSAGTLVGGDSITYRGVTLLEFDAGKVRSFRTYYDSAAFVPEFEKHLKRRRSL